MMHPNLKDLLITLLKPKALKNLSDRFVRPLLLIGVILIIGVFFYTAFGLDIDYEQGYIFKMIYIHVPASWWSLGIYAIMTFLGVMGFVTRIPQFHIMATCWLIPGLTFTIISLLSGMIWGKLTWGTFWVWDARLTTMFLHFLIYLSYTLFIYSSKNNNETAYAIGSILLIIGFVNLPLIKWSVDWWFTLHQSASINVFKKSAIHKSYLFPLLVNAIGFFFWSSGFFFLKMRKIVK